MKFYIYITLLAVLTLATTIMSLLDVSWPWTVASGAVTLALVALCFRSAVRPLNTVRNGIYLLREQDFSSRLCHTGQADADKVVDLFNGLMGAMKAERLKNLEQDRFLSLVVETSPMGIAICDFDGVIVRTNPAWDAMQTPSLTKAIGSVGEGKTGTVRLADSLIVRISKLWFMDSGFRRRFILVERLTEEIAAAEKQLFNKIVRTIGHEVNNTLGSVISVLESLKEMHSDDSLTTEAIDSSMTSCANLVSFVRGYADIVKLPPVAPEPTDLNRWLSRLYPSLAGITPPNISLKLLPAALPCSACIDPMLMERVMINVVKNAIESIGDSPDGEIVISLVPAGTRRESWRLTVADNGPGIPEDVAGHLFTPFFSTKRPDRGLGLMLIADILRAHRFPFSLDTDHQTGLTSFTVILASVADRSA